LIKVLKSARKLNGVVSGGPAVVAAPAAQR